MTERREGLRASPPAVGGSSLLVIFAVLCLTVFALLALSTVQANRRLETAAVETVTAYYAADTQAERILARLRGGEMPSGVTAVGNTYSYTVEISETQALEVAVRLEGVHWEILRWQRIYTSDWTPRDTRSVWDGESN